VLAIGAAAVFAARGSQRPVARFRTASLTVRGDMVGYWKPYFLDDATLALAHVETYAGVLPRDRVLSFDDDDSEKTLDEGWLTSALRLEVWSLETGRVLASATVDHVLGVDPALLSVSRCWLGENLIRVRAQDTLELYSPRTQTVVRTLKLGRSYCVNPALALSASGDFVATVTSRSYPVPSDDPDEEGVLWWKHALEVHATQTGALVSSVPLPDEFEVKRLRFSPREDLLLASDTGGFTFEERPRRAFVFSIAKETCVGEIALHGGSLPDWDDRGEVLAWGVANDNPPLDVFSPEGTFLRKIPLGDLSPDPENRPGRLRFCVEGDDPLSDRITGVFQEVYWRVNGTTRDEFRKGWWGEGVFDVREGRFVLRVPFDESLRRKEDYFEDPAELALSPSGRRLALVYRQGDVLVYLVPP
jgi:hypothetical protein